MEHSSKSDKLLASTRCQHCNVKLTVSGLESLQKESQPTGRGSTPQSIMGQSMLGGGKIDESFIVLDPSKQGRAIPQGRLDESFLMVGGTASLLKQGPGQAMQPSSSQAFPSQNLDDIFQQLARIFDIASGTTEVDQPLCLDCAAKVKEEINVSLAETEAECAAYTAALAELKAQDARPLPPKEFEAQMRAAEAELRDEEAKARQAEAELEEAQAELGDLRQQAGELEALEEQYWHSVNHLALELRAHAEQRSTLQRKIKRSQQQLERLQATNVYNHVFNIWHDGPFGTISGFRLGRTSSCPVEWDEINAAWGQAVLLLHTMAQACKLTFSGYRLIPMGSFSRIADKKGTMDLYGPVNKLYCTTYDRAMVSYLACLKEFYEFAQGRDKAEGRTPLEMVYAMEGDIVGGQSIKLMFNKDSKWTKALKYMLSNLKWALVWMIAVQSGRPLVGGGRPPNPTPAAAPSPRRSS